MNAEFPRLMTILLAMFAMATGLARESDATPIPILLDHRGLLTIDGVLRMDSEGTWGASNLVIKPIGGWAAQDYCLSNIVQGQGSVTADFDTKPNIRMVETTSEVKDAKGRKSLRVSYVLTPTDGGTATYEKVYVFLPLAVKDIAGGRVLLPNGKTVGLPEQFKEEIVVAGKMSAIQLEWGRKRLRVRSEKLQISLHDMRPKVSAFQVWLEYPEPKSVTSMQLEFDISAETIR